HPAAVSPLFRRRVPPRSTLFPYTTLFRSACRRIGPERRHHSDRRQRRDRLEQLAHRTQWRRTVIPADQPDARDDGPRERPSRGRSEEHTSELQSPCNLVCRLLLEKKKNTY